MSIDSLNGSFHCRYGKWLNIVNWVLIILMECMWGKLRNLWLHTSLTLTESVLFYGSYTLAKLILIPCCYFLSRVLMMHLT
jgi:hypothetical protein